MKKPVVKPATNPTLISTSSSDYINTSSREYAIYTAQNRAIPSSCDGLKDGQRKMLWLLRNKSDKIKTISLSGLSIQEGLFLHGDQSASDTISRLAAPYLNNIPLMEGVGAFGTRVAPDGWGAPRYTYVKRSKAAEALLYNDLDIVPLRPNYDGSVMEPVNFLPLVPLVLLNGVSGIAVGWSTEILPHSLKEIVKATLAAIDGKPIPKLVPSFDYLATTVKELGENSYEFRGKVSIDGSNTMKVTELPPDLSLERFRARLNQMEDDGEIHSYTDRSTKNIDVEIRFKRGVIDGWTEEQAINFLKLKSKTTQRIVTLDFNNTSIRQYDKAEDLIRAFVDWRLDYYSKRYTKWRADLTRDLNFALAIRACVKGKLPSFLPRAADKREVEQEVVKLTTGISLDDDQRERIVSFPSYRWSRDSISKIDEEITSLENQIKEYDVILLDPARRRQIYRDEVAALLNLKL